MKSCAICIRELSYGNSWSQTPCGGDQQVPHLPSATGSTSLLSTNEVHYQYHHKTSVFCTTRPSMSAGKWGGGEGRGVTPMHGTTNPIKERESLASPALQTSKMNHLIATILLCGFVSSIFALPNGKNK